MQQHNDFFDYLSDHFETTYWVPGNHEYYYFDLNKKSGRLHEKIRENVLLVNNYAIHHKNIKFIFSTLWTQISPVNQWKIKRHLSDFHVIAYINGMFQPAQYNQQHFESLSFIEQELSVTDSEKTVVVSHHVPTFLNYPEKYLGDVLNEAFAVELFDVIERNGPDYWIYGHHHENKPDFSIGKTHLITNQLGYVKYRELEGFQSNSYVEV
ncbi:MAG: metallophosphoesterase [Bacteroidetes bacterium]|nr:metallophosphoesterase [Bacteroidota bacterium]